MALITGSGWSPPWHKVREALANPKYDFRTVEGICRETGLDASEVQSALDQHKDEIRIAHATDNKGRLLYTLRSRSPTLHEHLFNIRTIVSSGSSTT